MVISFFSRKGGTGKTTLVCSLAGMLSQNSKVLLLDADPMSLSLRWYDKRKGSNLEGDLSLMQGFNNLTKLIAKVSKQFDYVLIDLAGQDSVELRSALLSSDVAIHVTRPSVVDEQMYQFTAELISKIKTKNKKLKIISVVSIVNDVTKTKVKFVKDQLKKLDLNPCKGSVKERKIYQDAMGMGKTVTEFNDRNAKTEMRKILQEVKNV